MKKIFIFILLIFLTFPDYAREPNLEKINFQESFEIFSNPERGFYLHIELNKLTELPELRKEAITIIYGKIRANEFREKDFSGEFLEKIKDSFNIIRRAGMKVIPCVSYGDKIGDADASKEQVFRHIDQLKPLLEKNVGIIYLMKAGFIGPWGEWHSSTHGLETVENRRDILFKILSSLPKERMVVVRSPRYKKAIFEGEVLSIERAFDGSNLARTGFHNDCFLSSDDDVGTYREEISRQAGIDYIGGETRFTPFGGETCGLYKYGECENSIKEMEQLHCSWLNSGYQPKVLKHWEENGCMDEIKRRLGYRFVLQKVEISEKSKPGGILIINFTINNVGFASPFNPRIVELVLLNNKTGDEISTKMSTDPRYWFPGNPISVSSKFQIPINLPEGNYIVLLRLPDPTNTLHDDAHYSIRFANLNIWKEKTGSNVIFDNLLIDSKVEGKTNQNAKEFKEIE